MKHTLAEFSQSQHERLQQIVTVIKEAVNIEILLLFSIHSTIHRHSSCFIQNKACIEELHLTFLVIMHPDCNHSDDYVQDVIESRCRKFALVTALVHKMPYAKTLLQKGHSFFSLVCRQGMLLYDAERISLKDDFNVNEESCQLTPEQAREKWIGTAQTFLLGAQFFLEKEVYKMSAFMLHQAAEHSLMGLIQVHTGYRSYTHNIDKLLRYSEIFTDKLKTIFPKNTPEEGELFRLLNSAYIKSRYKEDYLISDKEVAILSRRVNLMFKIVDRLCQQKIASLNAELQKESGEMTNTYS